MTDPVTASDTGVNLRPEIMEKEKIYHCFFRDKLMLFFKDSQDFFHCYEIEERDLVERVRAAPDADLEGIFEQYLKQDGDAPT